jgi:hypothetical protein
MTDVPPATPVTRPALETVAIAGADDTHGVVVAAFADPVNWVVNPLQTIGVPVMAGRALTMTVDVLAQPTLLV